MSTSKVKAALTRKIGPLPAWLWLTVLGGGIYYWRHRQAASAGAAVATGTAAGVPAGAGSGIGSTDTGGGGGGGDLPQPPMPSGGGTASWDPLQQPAGTDTAAPAPTDVAAPTTTAAASPLRPAGKLSQPLAAAPGTVQPLLWGGKTFMSKSAFDRWAGQHGTNTNAILALHPEAARIYGQLSGPAVAAAHAPADRGFKALLRSVVPPRMSRAPTAKPSTPSPPRPVSVRPAKTPSPTARVQPARAPRVAPQTRVQVAKGKPAVSGVPPDMRPKTPVPKVSPPAGPVGPAPAKTKPSPHAPTKPAPVKVAPVVSRTNKAV